MNYKLFRFHPHRLSKADNNWYCAHNNYFGKRVEYSHFEIGGGDEHLKWKREDIAQIYDIVEISINDIVMELIAEVPIEYWEEGGKILSSCMSEAGNFLPFPIDCDVTTTLRWYGLEYPCPYEKPQTLDELNESNIKWIQYMLIESEYLLPVFLNEDGSEPLGDAASGVNGVETDQLWDCVHDYIDSHKISTETFIDHIYNSVIYGEIKKENVKL